MTDSAVRPLTQEEENFLRFILEHGSAESKSYLPQIDGMRARRSCSCGCPSIALVVFDFSPAANAGKDRTVSDLCGLTAEGVSVGVLLFQDDGLLSELEIYPYDDNEGEFSLPTLESLSDPYRSGLK